MILLLPLALALQNTPPTPAPAPQTRPPACTSADHRAFDFWVGEWQVRPFAGGPFVARSKIERLYDGCAIRENWMPPNRGGGGSLSNYDRNTGKWHQTWVDSSGTRVLFEGGMQGDAMVLTGLWHDIIGPGKHGLVRMTYSREQGGVRQKGEVSADNGATWTPSFDFLYLPVTQ